MPDEGGGQRTRRAGVQIGVGDLGGFYRDRAPHPDLAAEEGPVEAEARVRAGRELPSLAAARVGGEVPAPRVHVVQHHRTDVR